MTDHNTAERRVGQWRLAVWLTTLVIGYFLFREKYPVAWQASAFGAAFTLIWPLFRRTQTPKLLVEETPSENTAAQQQNGLIDVVLDLLVTTVLVSLSGGFNSPFAWLYFLGVIEAYVLLGSAQSIYIALAASVLNLVNFQSGISLNSAVLYGMATGTLLVSALLVTWSQNFAVSRDAGPGNGGLFANSHYLKNRHTEALEARIDELEITNRQLRDTYRDVVRLNREQKTRIDLHRAAEQIHELSATISMEDEEAPKALSRLLRLLMDVMEAGGVMLWQRPANSEMLQVSLSEGRIAPGLEVKPILNAIQQAEGELRAECESRLMFVAPLPSNTADTLLPMARKNSQGGEAESEDINPYPVGVVLLYNGEKPNGLIGAVGICDPHGASRFVQADIEFLQELGPAIALAVINIEEKRQLQKRAHEVSILYDLSRLLQTATDIEQIYKAIVLQIEKILPCENCTLFLLEKGQNLLVAKASRGKVINLLDHISFDKGSGVSGWVAGKGRQIHIPDLTQEPNLLNVELIPPRIRSFAAAPLRVQNNVVGVINISHSQPNAFTPDDLRLLNIMSSQAAITIERSETFHTLETLAITDGLTQIYNHRYFQMRLDDELKRSKRYKQTLALMLVDVDLFKQVNDVHGHATGDGVLRELASLLHRSVRETEVVARYGGEEFAVMLPHTDMVQARIAAERVRSHVEAHGFSSLDGKNLQITVSIGLAASPGNGGTRQELIDSADQALYAAKEAGRNRVICADDMQNSAIEM